MLKERDQHLDEVFGIYKPQSQIVESSAVVVKESQNSVTEKQPSEGNLELRKSLEGNITKLDVLYEKMDSVLGAQIETAIEFSKSRDAEVVAKIGATMVSLIKEIRETNQTIHKPIQSDAPQIIGQQTNNVIQVGSMRDLNDALNALKDKK